MTQLQQVRVEDSTVILVVNVDLEAARYELYQKILNRLGTRKGAA